MLGDCKLTTKSDLIIINEYNYTWLNKINKIICEFLIDTVKIPIVKFVI